MISPEQRDYWLRTPHVFVPANWGPEYCELCLQAETGEKTEHLKVEDLTENDPRRHGFNVGHPVARPDTTMWKVEGWDDNGASCTYHDVRSFEAAEQMAADLLKDGDPYRDGRRYDHYVIHEIIWRTVADTRVHPVKESA